jgi:VCBS repeat protein
MTRSRAILLLAGLAGTAGLAGYLGRSAPPPPVPEAVLEPAPPVATEQAVHRFCGACHAYPPPDSFPRAAWRPKIREAYDIFGGSRRLLEHPSIESVALYYEERAPKKLPVIDEQDPPPGKPWPWERRGQAYPTKDPFPAVSHVSLTRLTDPKTLELLVCDCRLNEVRALRPQEKLPSWRTLGRVMAPAHVTVCDLDGDGRLDLLVACLGEFYPTDARVGSVVWLRGEGDGRFTPITLLEGVGRVADVRAADFRGVGRLDLIVAIFGWQNTGEILYLENQTTDWSKPTFIRRVLDERHGTIHVPVADLNGDGRPDFVALISQEHETIVAFLNEGGGKFRKETLYSAPHPAFGSSGIQLVDLDGDGNLDVLYTNGDGMDPPPLLKPYHGVGWLKNPGPGRFPFTYRRIGAMYGVQRAVAADFRGSGRLDVAAVSYLPANQYPKRERLGLPSVVVFEQTAPGRFVRHTLERGSCDHFSCALGALEGAAPSLVVGNFLATPPATLHDAVAVWRPGQPKD